MGDAQVLSEFILKFFGYVIFFQSLQQMKKKGLLIQFVICFHCPWPLPDTMGLGTKYSLGEDANQHTLAKDSGQKNRGRRLW